MSFFDLIPSTKAAELGVIAVVIALVVGAFGLQHVRLQAVKVELATEKQGRAQDRAAAADAAASGAVANLAETTRRVDAQSENANEAQRFASRSRADLDLRRTADDRLRSSFAAIAAASCGAATVDPAAVAAGPPASAPADLLAYVQRRVGEAGGDVGEYADAAHGAGQLCERDYDALTPTSIALPRAKFGQ